MTTVLITGNTYPVKDALRALGGTWDAAAKGWRVPADKADAARKLLPTATASKWTTAPARSPAAARRRGDLCPECGDDCGGTYSCGYA